MALLEVKNLSKSFSISKDGGWGLATKELLQVVRGVDLSIDTGEILVLVGESGCGKSTLARLVTRLTEPDSGEINFDEPHIVKWAPIKLATEGTFGVYNQLVAESLRDSNYEFIRHF